MNAMKLWYTSLNAVDHVGAIGMLKVFKKLEIMDVYNEQKQERTSVLLLHWLYKDSVLRFFML